MIWLWYEFQVAYLIQGRRISTGSTGSIEPVDFWKRHNGTCKIAKMIRIESVNFHDIVTLEPVISKT